MKVYVSTTSPHKKKEIESELALYGIRSVGPDQADAILSEQSALLLGGENVTYTWRGIDHVFVCHKSLLTLFFPALGKKETYTGQSEGYLDLQRAKEQPDAFGWDAALVNPYTNQTAHEHSMTRKVSARQVALERMLAVHAKISPQAFSHLQTNSPELGVVEFTRDPGTVLSSTLASAVLRHNKELEAVLFGIVNQGQFLRSAQNKRQRNYWFAGLNSGIPTTPKSDPLHELTYFVHDVIHQSMPDPVLMDNSPRARYGVIMSRIMSEVVSLYYADMVFVDAVRKEFPEYDVEKRAIYPVYRELKPGVSHSHAIMALAELMLFGYSVPLLSLGVSQATINKAAAKYHPFFCRDYDWSISNTRQMLSWGGGKKTQHRRRLCQYAPTPSFEPLSQSESVDLA